ncbi:MAG TPA: radical SAM protein [Blastocatellia bacterium]|nr:radical SAM protein [Blastocatellia bacterium]
MFQEASTQQSLSAHETAPYRVDVPLYTLLQKSSSRSGVPHTAEPVPLPEPEFPQQKRTKDLKRSGVIYHANNGVRAFRRWLMPYMQSRVMANEFRPLLSYLFTEWKCNLDCHYCWAFDNSVKGMTEDIARRSIDFLHSVGCRVTAIMGGEPLLRPKFIHKVIYYGSKRGFFMYLPTNGRLMTPQVIDWIGDSGVAAVNLAVDCVSEKPGLPKALNHIRQYFNYLVKMQRRYGYIVVFNMNICRTNMDDVKELTEIAHDHGISTDYHINETPMIEQSHFKHLDENSTYLMPEDWPRVDDLLDHLIEKNRQGYIMVNSKAHLQRMKAFMRGHVDAWNCRAGQNSMLIRTDGTIAPCFPLYSATYDWGAIENPKFDFKQLGEMKKGCNPHCLSTTQYVLGHYYNNQTVLRWILKQALHGLSADSTAVAQA